MAIIPFKRKFSDYLVNPGDESEDVLEPIVGYASKPIVSLEEACQPLHSMSPRLSDFVCTAKIRSRTPANNLTQDESAAIRLYTMQCNDKIDGPNASLYSNLNRTLRDSDQRELQPWFSDLKLFLTASNKLPLVSAKMLWRGVRDQDIDKYIEADTFDGRSVQDHSDFSEEDEVLLLPGTCLNIYGKLNAATDLHIIQLKQIHLKHELLERPFTAMDPLTHEIVAGDTLWDLSLKYNCSAQDIKVMNLDVQPTKLKIGQIMQLPVNAVQSQPEMHSNDDSDVIHHMVFPEDTLEYVAQWYHCTIQDLMNLNPNV